jgi:hypothetical protein
MKGKKQEIVVMIDGIRLGHEQIRNALVPVEATVYGHFAVHKDCDPYPTNKRSYGVTHVATLLAVRTGLDRKTADFLAQHLDEWGKINDWTVGDLDFDCVLDRRDPRRELLVELRSICRDVAGR